MAHRPGLTAISTDSTWSLCVTISLSCRIEFDVRFLYSLSSFPVTGLMMGWSRKSYNYSSPMMSSLLTSFCMRWSIYIVLAVGCTLAYQ